MLPISRSVKDPFGVQTSYKLTKYYAYNNILCHMALLGLKRLKNHQNALKFVLKL